MYNYDILTKYDSLFEDFLINIALTQTQSRLIDDTLCSTIGLFMSTYDDLDIYAQGSYAMGLMVKPLTSAQSRDGIAGEYDVDIVLERGSWKKPIDSLGSIRKILLTEYAQKVDHEYRESCERVYHSKDLQTEVLFHADYVPILSQFGNRHIAKRSNNSWHYSDTKEWIEWFSEFVSNKPFVQSLIIMLKRIRDVAGLTKQLPSICITSIVCNCYKQSGSYVEDLLNTLEQISNIFNQPYSNIKIELPTTGEDLTRKIKPTDRNRIKIAFWSCLDVLRNEFLHNNKPDLEKIQEYLSTDFPSNLEEYPECLEALRRRGFGIELDGSLKQTDIIEEAKTASSVIKNTWYKYYGKGKRLKFIANNYDKTIYGIRWQVLNAEGSDDRRGRLFEAKGKGGNKNSNEFENWETESYDGVHWIKYFIYDKRSKKVVEIGKKFHVEVNSMYV